MADISKVTLPSGSTYNLKDTVTRNWCQQFGAHLEALQQDVRALSSYTTYLGVTTTELEDDVTTEPKVMIAGTEVTAKVGNIVTFKKKEFIYNGTTWQEFGDMSALKALAFKDSASATYTPHGTVTVRTNPMGTVTAPTFTGEKQTLSVTGECTVQGKAVTGDATATYTPSGSVTKPTASVTKSTGKITGMSSVGSLPSCTLPSLTTTVSDETLTFSWSEGSFSAGTLPTKATEQTFMTDASVDVSKPSFAGDGTILKGFVDSSVDYTPKGDISQPDFKGSEGIQIVSLDGAQATITVQ